jgi:hypothetical protein
MVGVCSLTHTIFQVSRVKRRGLETSINPTQPIPMGEDILLYQQDLDWIVLIDEIFP